MIIDQRWKAHISHLVLRCFSSSFGITNYPDQPAAACPLPRAKSSDLLYDVTTFGILGLSSGSSELHFRLKIFRGWNFVRFPRHFFFVCFLFLANGLLKMTFSSCIVQSLQRPDVNFFFFLLISEGLPSREVYPSSRGSPVTWTW